MDKSTEQYICKTEGFSTRGFPRNNEDSNEMLLDGKKSKDEVACYLMDFKK